MLRLGGQHPARLVGREIRLGQIKIPPIDPMQFRSGHVPRMMRIGKTHPAKPRRGIAAREPGQGPISNPIRVVMRSGDIHWPNLHCTGVPLAGSVLALLSNHRVELRLELWMGVHRHIVMTVTFEEVVG